MKPSRPPITPWQRDVLANTLQLTPDEVDRIVQVLDAIPDGPCGCTRIPWKPHRHHFLISAADLQHVGAH